MTDTNATIFKLEQAIRGLRSILTDQREDQDRERERRLSSMCLWEAVLNADCPELDEFSDQQGYAELRSTIAAFTESCDKGWEIAHNEAGFEDCFDWDWCPWFIKNCLDITDHCISLKPDWQDRCRKWEG